MCIAHYMLCPVHAPDTFDRLLAYCNDMTVYDLPLLRLSKSRCTCWTSNRDYDNTKRAGGQNSIQYFVGKCSSLLPK